MIKRNSAHRCHHASYNMSRILLPNNLYYIFKHSAHIGDIHQLHGPNFTQFLSPTYPPRVENCGHFTWCRLFVNVIVTNFSGLSLEKLFDEISNYYVIFAYFKQLSLPSCLSQFCTLKKIKMKYSAIFRDF